MQKLLAKVGKCYPLKLELISIALLILGAYMAFSSYAILPESIPTHFGSSGTPDAYSSKASIFSTLGMNVVLFLLLSGITVLMATSKDPRRYINLPIRWKNLSEDDMERTRVLSCRFIFVLKLLMQSLSVYIVYITVETAFGRAAGIGIVFYLILAAIFISMGVMTWQIVRINRKGNDSFNSPDQLSQ